jgi:hypothetical protein
MEYSNADFEEKFFPGAEMVSVDVKVLQETYAEMTSIIQRNGWSLEKGLRILLCQGLGYAKGRLVLEAQDEERRSLAVRTAECESLYAVMKFEAFHLMQDNQTLEMRESALRNADRMSVHTIQRLRTENDALRSELEMLRVEMGKLREKGLALQAPAPNLPDDAQVPSRPLSWWRRICRGLQQAFTHTSIAKRTD